MAAMSTDWDTEMAIALQQAITRLNLSPGSTWKDVTDAQGAIALQQAITRLNLARDSTWTDVYNARSQAESKVKHAYKNGQSGAEFCVVLVNEKKDYDPEEEPSTRSRQIGQSCTSAPPLSVFLLFIFVFVFFFLLFFFGLLPCELMARLATGSFSTIYGDRI